MKNSRLLMTLPVAAALLCSCAGEKKEVGDFASDFARKVQAAEIDSLKAVYPAIEDADSLALTFVADSLAIEKSDKEGMYNVSYGNGVAITVKKEADGRFVVTDSRGLFAYPKEKEQFARKIGALEGIASDTEKAKRMATVDLVAEDIYSEYSDERKNAIENLGLTITRDIMFMMDEGEGYYTLKNTTGRPIKGSDYTVTWEISYIGMGYDNTSYRTDKGKDIPANGTVKFPVSFTGHDHMSISKITMKELSREEFMADYTPIGNEYEAYSKRHPDAADAAGKKLSDGPYNIKGKIGGKYAVHIKLEKGMKQGYYYYDKNGPSARLKLKVLDFNPKTGKLILEEHNDKGHVTGTFNGTLTAAEFIGQMTSFQGKIYDFSMTVE